MVTSGKVVEIETIFVVEMAAITIDLFQVSKKLDVLRTLVTKNVDFLPSLILTSSTHPRLSLDFP